MARAALVGGGAAMLAAIAVLVALAARSDGPRPVAITPAPSIAVSGAGERAAGDLVVGAPERRTVAAVPAPVPLGDGGNGSTGRHELVVELVGEDGAVGSVAVSAENGDDVEVAAVTHTRSATETEVRFAVAPGRWTLCVEMDQVRGPLPRTIDVDGPTRVRIVLGRHVQRTVRVVRHDGAPVAHGDVQVSARHDERSPVVVRRVATKADGDAVIAGEAGVVYSLRVTGDHACVQVDGVVLDVAEPLIVRVPAGATLRVRTVPREAAQDLSAARLWLALRGSDGALQFARWADGALVFRDATAGLHTVEFAPHPRVQFGVLAGTLTTVMLTAGRTVDLELPLPWFGVATVQPRVTSSARFAYVLLQREPDPALPAGLVWRAAAPVGNDDSVRVLAGRYRARLPNVPQALSTAIVDAPDGASLAPELHVPLGVADITLVDAHGEPVRDRRVALARDGVLTDMDRLGWTDDDGRLRAECGVGTLGVAVFAPEPPRTTIGGAAIGLVEAVVNDEPRTIVGTLVVRADETATATFVVR